MVWGQDGVSESRYMSELWRSINLYREHFQTEKQRLTSVPESLKVVLAASRVSPDEAEDAGGLTPGKDDNEVWRNPAPQIMPFLGLTEH